jgi:UDP-MurNAc hydroxylase
MMDAQADRPLAAPSITMVGHASVVIETDDIVVWTDPWLVSRAFNDSWGIHPPPVIDDSLIERVTHIWISHEHPDHFNVPTLRQLSETIRDRVHILIQAHPEDSPAAFLRSNGFTVTELAPGDPTALNGTTLTCYPIGHEDSALMIDSAGFTILELNDCKPTKGELRRMLGNHNRVDVLLDQFSGAGWNGNPGDADRKRQQADRVRSSLTFHLDTIDPVWFVPFASFVRFEHEENQHLHEHRITVSDTVKHHQKRQIAVLAPGDCWQIDQPWAGTEQALAQYATAEAEPFTPVRSEAVSANEITEAASRFIDMLHDHYQPTLLRRIRAVRFIAEDEEAVVADLTIAPGEGVIMNSEIASTVVRLSSQAAFETFERRWGMSTLLISGRFTMQGPEAPFNQLKQLSAAAATGMGTRNLVRQLRDSSMRALLVRTLRRRLP